jgi:hypothetical protein
MQRRPWQSLCERASVGRARVCWWQRARGGQPRGGAWLEHGRAVRDDGVACWSQRTRVCRGGAATGCGPGRGRARLRPGSACSGAAAGRAGRRLCFQTLLAGNAPWKAAPLVDFISYLLTFISRERFLPSVGSVSSAPCPCPCYGGQPEEGNRQDDGDEDGTGGSTTSMSQRDGLGHRIALVQSRRLRKKLPRPCREDAFGQPGPLSRPTPTGNQATRTDTLMIRMAWNQQEEAPLPCTHSHSHTP